MAGIQNENDRIRRVTDCFEESRETRGRSDGDDHYYRCPVCAASGGDHSGRNLSMRYDASHGKMMMHCYNGHSQDEILPMVGLDWFDLVIRPENPDAFYEKYYG